MKHSNNIFIQKLTGIDHVVGYTMRVLCIVCLTLLLILLTGNVLFRFVPIMSMGWYDEIVEILFAWLVFIGAAALWRESSHFRVEWIYAKLENRTAGNIIGIIIELLSLFFLIVMTYQGLKLTMMATAWTPILKFPRRVQYVDIPIAGGLMVIYSIRNIGRHIRYMKDA